MPSASRKAVLAAVATWCGARRSVSADGPASIKARLDAADARLLTKPKNGFAGPPAEATYPDWLEGEWKARTTFAGYELPAKDVIPRDKLFAEEDVPGFKKCSLAMFPDVGKDGVEFEMRWARDASGAVREDRAANLRAAMRGGLGYDAVERVDYKIAPSNPIAGLGFETGPNNPNRIRLVFAPGLTKNADRIELFINARQTEAPSADLFYVAEEMRQITYSARRSINGEYAHFVSYRRRSDAEVRCGLHRALLHTVI